MKATILSLNLMIEKKDVIQPDHSLSIQSTIDELESSLQKKSKFVHGKLQHFIIQFNEEFPANKTIYSIRRRAKAEAIIWALMDEVLMSYSLSINASVIIELYGILERLTMREFVELICRNKNMKLPLQKFIERRTLLDVADFFSTTKIWNESDINLIRKLTKLRNAVAHKNPNQLSKLLNSGKKISYLDVDVTVSKLDMLSYIVAVINLLLKLLEMRKVMRI